MPLNLSRREQVIWISLFGTFLAVTVAQTPGPGPGERLLLTAAVLVFPVVFALRHLRIRGRALLPGWQD